jgi:hypothetical protein
VPLNPLQKPVTPKTEMKAGTAHAATRWTPKRPASKSSHKVGATKAKPKYQASGARKPVKHASAQPVKHIERASMTTVTSAKSKKPSPSIRKSQEN